MKTATEYLNEIRDQIKTHVPPESHAKLDEIERDLIELGGHLKIIGTASTQLLMLSAASLIHFCRLAGKPHGKNEETGPDYDAMATEAVELATESMPSLFRELGIEGEEESEP